MFTFTPSYWFTSGVRIKRLHFMMLRVLSRTLAIRLPHQLAGVVVYASLKSSVPKNIRFFTVDIEKAAARAALKEAINELTEKKVPSDSEISYASTATLLEWDKTPLELLTAEQLSELGRAWFEGLDEGVEPNFERAFEVWTEGAKRGDNESVYGRAVMLREGKGVAKNPEEAFRILEAQAREVDFYFAHYAVGIMYSTGEGVAQNHEKAFHHFGKAVLKGVLPAIHNVGNCFANGLGIAQSDENAIRCYEEASRRGDPSSKFTLGTWLYKGRGLPVDKQRAYQLQLEAAQAGHPRAMFNTGAAYMEGTGVEQNMSSAVEWFERAARAGMPEAAINWGSMYRSGVGTGPGSLPKDLHKALEIFKQFPRNEICVELAKAVEVELGEAK